MIKRSVGLFSGFAMMFVGVSVCFYVVKTKTDVVFKSNALSINLITASPGIIAMILGATLIMFTIWSKDIFPDYQEKSQSTTMVKPKLPVKAGPK
jgi:hypothetical protein